METQIEERQTPAGDPPAIADGNGTSTAAPPAAETSAGRFRRKARRTRFHLYAFVSVALLVCLVALVVANTRQVELSWVVGSSTASLVWIILFSAILGWLLGVATSALFSWRTRERRP